MTARTLHLLSTFLLFMNDRLKPNHNAANGLSQPRKKACLFSSRIFLLCHVASPHS